MGTTNNFQPKKPRQLFLGPFAVLELSLARAITESRQTPLTPLTILVPTRLLGLHLQRALARLLPTGHANLRFQTLTEISNLQSPIAPPLALELLCRQIAQKCTGYFAPVNDTPGFASALLATFTDLKEAGLTTLPGAIPKLRELSTAYESFCAWLTAHNLHTEADLLLKPDIRQPTAVFLYGFYDLNPAQRRFIEHLTPSAVFFPATEHTAYSQPLLDWFQSLGYATTSSPISNPQSQISLLSAPGEPAEIREAIRAALQWLRDNPGKTFNDIAILCRSRDQYDALLRDTLPALDIPAYFRGGRPLSEHPDARLLLLLLEAIRTDFSRAAVMELACHIGPHSQWDALTVELGIVNTQQQWLTRLHPDDPRTRSLAKFINDLFRVTGTVPKIGSWPQFIEPVLAAFQHLGGSLPAVLETVRSLADLDTVQSPIDLDTFAEFSQKALDAGRQQPGHFQDGAIFISDVMAARGLSFPLVIVLGLVEKSFPRLVREDPLLLDDERQRISADLQLKSRGHAEERLLFDLARASATEQLILTYPRLDPGTARPRVPSFLLLEATGAKSFKSLPGTVVPLGAHTGGADALDEREFDLAALQTLPAPEDYLASISSLLLAGVTAEKRRWRERSLTRHDGLIEATPALALLRDRFGLDKLVISATSLEHFFACPFYYFHKHVLHLEQWEEPETALAIDPADLGSLYHAILEDYYRAGQTRDIAALADEHFRHFEHNGVTGYPAVWEIKKDIIRHELTAFAARERRRLGDDWLPAKFEEEFRGTAVAPPVRLRGKIDRIDLDPTGHRARVLDYKTGKLPTGLENDSLVAGEALQLPLYLLAAENLLPGVTVESASYLYFTLRGGYREIHFTGTALVERRAELTHLLETAAAMIRDGRFAQYATEDGCRYCDFRPICGNGILKLYARKSEDPRMKDFRDIKETTA